MLPPPLVPVPLLVPVPVPVPVLLLVPPVLVLVPASMPESTPTVVAALLPAEDVVLVPTPVLELPPIVTTEPLLELLAPVQRLCCWMVVRNVPHPVSSAAVRAGMHCGCSVVGNVMQHAESIAQLMPAAGGLPASSEVIGLPVAHASAAIPSINAASAPATHTFRSFMFEPFVGSARCHR